MKVIDLLNKIVNEEKVPEYVAYFNREDEINDKMMVCEENIVFKLNRGVILLKDEVEVIEKTKKIEKLKKTNMTRNQKKIVHKINEIIDYINKGD